MTDKSQPAVAYYSGNVKEQRSGSPSTSADDAPLITMKWTPLLVSSIEAIHIVDKKYFQEDEKITTSAGTPLNLYGKLKEADLKVTFSLPYAVSKDKMSTFFRQCTGLFSEDIDVKVGYTSDLGAPEPRLQDPQKFSILVPLLRGYQYRKPIADYVNLLSEEEFIHFTLNLCGATWPSMTPTTWRIRLKVSQMQDRIECVSVSSSLVDMPRMKETSSNLACWVSGFSKKLENFVPFGRRRTQSMSTSQESMDQYRYQQSQPGSLETPEYRTTSGMYSSPQTQRSI